MRNDDTKIFGYWWFANHKDLTFYGVLEKIDTRWQLKMVNKFDKESVSIIQNIFNKTLSIDNQLIHGISTEHDKITLLDASCSRRLSSHDDMNDIVCCPSYLIQGEHHDKDTLFFQNATFRFYGLETWFGHSIITNPYFNAFKNQKLIINDPPKHKYDILSIKSHLYLTGNFSINDSDSAITVNNQTYLSLEFNEVKTIDEIENHFIFPFRSLLCYFMNYPTDWFLWISYNEITNVTNRIVSCYARQKEDSLNKHDVFVPFKTIENEFSQILNKYFSEFDRLQPLVYYFTHYYLHNQGTSVDQYIYIMRTLEAYDRKINTHKIYVEENEFDGIKMKIGNFISQLLKDHSNKELEESFISKIKYANDISLKNRLNHLFTTYKDFQIFDNKDIRKDYCYRLSKLRNDLTHYGYQLENEEDISNLNTFLNNFITGILYLELGIGTDNDCFRKLSINLKSSFLRTIQNIK